MARGGNKQYHHCRAGVCRFATRTFATVCLVARYDVITRLKLDHALACNSSRLKGNLLPHAKPHLPASHTKWWHVPFHDRHSPPASACSADLYCYTPASPKTRAYVLHDGRRLEAKDACVWLLLPRDLFGEALYQYLLLLIYEPTSLPSTSHGGCRHSSCCYRSCYPSFISNFPSSAPSPQQDRPVRALQPPEPSSIGVCSGCAASSSTTEN